MKKSGTLNEIRCGDCLEVMPALPRATMIFADPPDNLGMKYNGSTDRKSSHDYRCWLGRVFLAGMAHCDIFWLSYYHKYQHAVGSWVDTLLDKDENGRQFIWRFTFGQHNKYDCGNGYRPILRIMQPQGKLYPDAIRVPSKRQTLYNDKRANPAGRVPDDVWEFSRVCGSFQEKRKWHPNQHPEALIERTVKLSCVPGDLVIDMFAGTGTVNRVCKRLGIDCIGIEISEVYCKKIVEETGATRR